MYGFPDIFDMNKYVKGRDYQCVSACLPASLRVRLDSTSNGCFHTAVPHEYWPARRRLRHTRCFSAGLTNISPLITDDKCRSILCQTKPGSCRTSVAAGTRCWNTVP